MTSVVYIKICFSSNLHYFSSELFEVTRKKSLPSNWSTRARWIIIHQMNQMTMFWQTKRNWLVTLLNFVVLLFRIISIYGLFFFPIEIDNKTQRKWSSTIEEWINEAVYEKESVEFDKDQSTSNDKKCNEWYKQW